MLLIVDHIPFQECKLKKISKEEFDSLIELFEEVKVATTKDYVEKYGVANTNIALSKLNERDVSKSIIVYLDEEGIYLMLPYWMPLVMEDDEF